MSDTRYSSAGRGYSDREDSRGGRSYDDDYENRKKRQREDDHYDRDAKRHKSAESDAPAGGRQGEEMDVDSARPRNEPQDGRAPETESKDSAAERRKREPVSLEELMKQKRMQDQQEQKPVFLTKTERREAALKKRAEEVARIKRGANDQRRQLYSGGRDDGRRERSRSPPRRDYKTGARAADSGDSDLEPEGMFDEEVVDDARLKEVDLIKRQKLGIKQERKKRVKASEKYKIVFNWDAKEDTSRDINPLYDEKVEIRPQFGRGFIAGIDKKEQLMHYHDLVTKSQQELADKARMDKARYERQMELLERHDKRQLHWDEKKLSEMTTKDWRILREEFSIATKGGGIPQPIRNWKEAELPDWLQDAIRDAGYKKPTAIQMQAIPIGLQNRDIIGIAETGSGKTASFVIPMLIYIASLPPLTHETEIDGPLALVLAPTRELAVQIESEARKFCKYKGYRTVCVVGGADIQQQAFDLRRGCEIVVATPGRLVDCIESRYIVLNQCNYVVLDEADRMMELGFEKEVNQILDAMPRANLKSANEDEAAKQESDRRNIWRTTIMYSATMPATVERVATTYMRRPATIMIGEVGKAVDRIKQVIEFAKGQNDKNRKLEDLLRNGPRPPIIVFANQKKHVDMLCKVIIKLGFKAVSLHSGKTQDQREAALEDFRAGVFDILVATDVAGRGLDVKGITHVINYDLPKSIEDYTHRIGRTGRAGASGLATSFLTSEDTEIMYDLKQMLTKTNNTIPNELEKNPAAQNKPGSQPATLR